MEKSKAKPAATSSPSFGVQDILYVLFKHKWMILLLTLLGLGAAGYMWKRQIPLYRSSSKLLIRYVLAKGSIDPYESVSAPGGGGRGKADPVMNTEIEILHSEDLLINVAKAVGPERLLPSAGADTPPVDAVPVIRGGLVTEPGFSPSVVYVIFNHEDPVLARDVLTHLLEEYFKRHLEIHRSAAEFDLVAKQVEDAKSRLAAKEKELDQIRRETGIMTLTDATAALTAQKSKTQEDLLAARAELAEKQAALQELEKDSKEVELAAAEERAARVPGGAAPQAPPSGVISEYRSVVELIAFLQKRDLELRIKFKPGNRLLVLNRQQMETNEARRRALEQQYPSLAAQVDSATTMAGDPASPRAKWIAQKAGLAAGQAKISVLNAHLKEIGEQFGREYSIGARVETLQRERDMLDSEYRTLESKLKSARVETTLDPSRMPNITIFQQPTKAVKTYDEKFQKIIYGVAGSGLGLGLMLAFLIELVFNRKISRPIEIQTRLQLPLLLTIPYLGGKARGRFMLPGAADLPLLGDGGKDELSTTNRRKGASAAARSEHFILPYAETLRDRIIFNFEVNNVIHKPKFVAVTGLSEGAGASTIAAGLAKSFSEINGSKVLLVDLSSLHPEQNPIFGEVPLHTISGALELTERKDFKETEDNLFYASAVARRDDTGLTSFTPIHLYELMPHLQSSAYDYIIFDMPSLGETSRTLAMAGLMDKVLLVLDAENTSRDALKWGYSELVKGKADVSCIFNKTRSNTPGWLIG